MSEKEPVIVGVKHKTKYLPEQLKTIEESIKPNTRIGIEIEQYCLNGLIKIQDNRARNAEREARKLALRSIKKNISEAREKERDYHKKHSTAEYYAANAEDLTEDLLFWNEIIKIARKKNCEIIALESHHGYDRRQILSAMPKTAKGSLLSLIRGPVKESFIARMIARKGLQASFVGAEHAVPIEAELKKIGFKPKTIFAVKSETESPLIKLSLKLARWSYAKRKSLRRKNLKAKIGKQRAERYFKH